MKAPNRDLLVLVKNVRDNEEAMELELTRLHSLLLDVENPHTFSSVYEVIDCNRSKVFSDSRRIMQVIASGEAAFVFLNNMN